MMASYACSLPRICQSVEVSGSMALNVKSVNVYRIKDMSFLLFSGFFVCVVGSGLPGSQINQVS
ncbi:hypothetical protein Peur_010242 [Populus x canadensis]